MTAGGTLHFGLRKISVEPFPDKMVQIIFDTGILRLLDITIVHVSVVVVVVVDDDDDVESKSIISTSCTLDVSLNENL